MPFSRGLNRFRALNRARALFLPVAIALLVSALCAPPARAIDVGAGTDRYAGSGGLLLPAGVDPGTRHEASSCPDCRWRLSDPCAGDGGPCLAITRGCAQLASLLRIRLSSDAGAHWSDRGLVCIPPSGPVTVADVGSRLMAEFSRLVPALAPRTEPAVGLLPRIPVNFISGQPAGLGPSRHSILGQEVVLHPSVSWSWEFGDGGVWAGDDPGSAYPAGGVRHAYRRGGAVTVQVRSRWSGTFEVAGLGPFRVSGAIDQTAPLDLVIGQGRAVLVP